MLTRASTCGHGRAVARASVRAATHAQPQPSERAGALPPTSPRRGAIASKAGRYPPLVALVVLFAGCTPAVMRSESRAPAAATTTAARAATGAAAAGAQTGVASWYGPGFAGRRTANGEVFDPSQLTAAHRELPFNTLVRVVNETNGKSVVVRINDRGPFKGGRVIDLSRAGAEAIDMIGSGVARVRLEVLSLPAGVVRVGTLSSLRGFEVASRDHVAGTLLALTPVQGGEPVVVRVVAAEFPTDTPADLLVGLELYASVGSEARVVGD
ncbi:MAG: septal ring lytic transglycosylase RlpA family protein [Trueperaceae bacterium]|nr:septal ring lytic transglycosylase RlpA family protein [Trueperaceae bacterium]